MISGIASLDYKGKRSVAFCYQKNKELLFEVEGVTFPFSQNEFFGKDATLRSLFVFTVKWRYNRENKANLIAIDTASLYSPGRC